jgi:hypothetical protein
MKIARTVIPLFDVVVLLLLASSVLAAGGALQTVRDFGAQGDGQADDTAAIQKAVDSGIGEIRFPRGIYRLTRTIMVDLDRVGPISLAGGGTARLVMAGPGPALKLVGTHQGTADPPSFKPNVWERQRAPLVDGLEIVGAHDKACGVEASGTMQLTITRMVIRKALHAVHLTQRNRNVIVADCHLYENRGAGIFYDNLSLHQSNITNCHISYNAAGGVVCRGCDVRNIQIGSCDIEANMDPKGPPAANVLIDCTGGAAGVAEIAITGCTLQHSNVPDAANIRYIAADAKDRRWGHFTITGNVLSDVAWNIDLKKARGVTITGNTFWMGFTGDLRAEECSNIVMGCNTFDRNPNYNYGRSREAKGGLVFRNCKDCSLTGLHINGVQRTAAGLVVEKCSRFLIANCTILDCDNAGALLDDVSDSRLGGCLIRNDLAEAKSWKALKIQGGRNNRIEDASEQ